MSHTIPTPARRALALALLAAMGSAGAAPADAPADGFRLGRIVVEAEASTATLGELTVSPEQLDRLSVTTVDTALAATAGVTLSNNSRNESMVYLRGFDPRQVPVFLDGIPQYVPYDGYIDFGRFTTFDLAEIRVAKGAASLLYGPNTLGGAINLVSRQPSAPLEGDLRLGVGSSGERRAAANVGLRQGDWYLQGGASQLEADSFPLPEDFIDYKTNPTDRGSERENAYRNDRRLSIKLDYAPSEGREFALGYVRQDGEKGNPVYTGRAGRGVRYWRWPWWDKESVYFIGNLAVGEQASLRLRAYEDRYGNGLEAYTGADYAQQILNTSFPSTYSDVTGGLSVALSSQAIAGHDLQLALHYKADRHLDSNPKSEDKAYRDITTSLALEDRFLIGARYGLRLGASHEKRDAREVYHWPTGSTRASNGLIELQRELEAGGQVFASASHKTRFPTIKDRYSARMGRALPNPDLKPERALHLELGWRGTLWPGAQVEASLFHARIGDLIQDALVDSDQCGGTVCDQAQNIGRARHRGAELTLTQTLSDRARLGATATWLDRDNLDDRSLRLTDSPRQRLFAYAEWDASERWTAVATLEAEQGRFVTYNGPGHQNGFLPLAGYANLGAKLVWSPREDLSIEGGGRNLGDRWYELAEGYPMPGRSWFVNASYTF